MSTNHSRPDDTWDVVVVGSINADVILAVDRMPGGGETTIASSTRRSSGGKGANQAVAAASDGARVALIGAVGDDFDGRSETQALAAAGVDTRAIVVSPRVGTGTACIFVTPDGENRIIVAPGANASVSAETTESSLDSLGAIRVVVCQNEVPAPAVAAAAKWSLHHGSRFILNAAPVAMLDPSCYAAADPLIVNEHEAAELIESTPGDDFAATGRELQRKTDARSIVITLGERGCYILSPDGESLLAAQKVDVVDTTGAGDAFVGAVASSLARGAHLTEAAREGGNLAAQTVGVHGARLPTGKEQH